MRQIRYGVRGALALTVAAGALVLLPLPTASAGTASYSGGSLTVNGDAAGETITTTFNETTDTVTLTGVPLPSPPAGCALAAGTITCTGVTGTYTLNTGDGADVVTASGEITIDLGAGNDQVTFIGNQGAKITGGPDNDTLIAQGPLSSFGSATTGGTGNDVLRGGPAFDNFSAEPGADTYVGGSTPLSIDVSPLAFMSGPAMDSLSYSGATPINVSLDGVANDGVAGENDNVGNDITAIQASTGNDRIDLSGGAFGGAVLGSDGDDVLIGTRFGDLLVDGRGADDVRGGPGNDRIGSGASYLGEFYPDSDYLGAASADRYDGGEGDDRLGMGILQIADGVLEGLGAYGADVFIGGPGSDTVVADARTCLVEPYSCSAATHHDVVVSLDDVANDGFVGINVGINVHSDIEAIESGAGNDTLTGSAASNTISGGAGNDTINPLGGADAVLGGFGIDSITSRDSVADAVDCGPGVDAGVVGDTTDALINCEGANNLVVVPGAGRDTSAPVVTAPKSVKLTVKKLAKAKALKVGITVDDVSMVLASATTTKLSAGSNVLLGESALSPGAGKRTVVVKLSKSLVKKVVNRAKRLRKGLPVKLKLVVVNQGGVATTKVITVKVVR